MNDELLERLVVAFERMAVAQEAQAQYLTALLQQNAERYEKHDQWRRVSERRELEAGNRKEREVQIAERRYEFDMSMWAAKIAAVENEDETYASFVREVLRDVFERGDFERLRAEALKLLRAEQVE